MQLGLEDELQDLQSALLADPSAGDTDPGTGGLRKVRLRAAARHKGKRGGARAHYLYLAAHGVIYLLFVYGKDEQSTLSRDQKKRLAAVVHSIKQEWVKTVK
ncbi:MAG: hypothetical protein ACREND_14160 [Gemmatimonadaceae bacterium]